MITRIDHEYKIKECVVLKHDPEKLKRMITSIRIYNEGDICYDLACGGSMTTAFSYEIERIKEYEDSY